MLTYLPFSDEQARLLCNLRQRYEVWMAAERTRSDLPYDLRRKHISGRDYLYRIFDRGGNGQSLGPMTPEREVEFEHYHARKQALKEQIGHLRGALAESAALYRALRLRSEEHTSELQSLMRISYAVFCLKKKKK